MRESTGSVEFLKKRIEEDAREEARSIISRAERSAGELKDRYSSDAEKIRKETVEKAEIEGKAVRRRIISGVSLETRRMSLQSREEVIAEVVSKAKAKLDALRKEDAYRNVLRDLLVEAFEVLEEKDVIAVFDGSDRSLLDEGFISGVESRLREIYGDDTRFEVSGEFHRSGGGVILRSKNGRVSFDNTFDARLRRMRDSLRLSIAKEVFG